MTLHELTIDEIILHEILLHIVEQKTITDGDEVVIQHQTDIIQPQQTSLRDSDHVENDIMYLVDENGML